MDKTNFSTITKKIDSIEEKTSHFRSNEESKKGQSLTMGHTQTSFIIYWFV